MELTDYLNLLRKRWIAIVVLAVAGAGLGGGLSLLMTPVYQARAQVFVSVRGADTTSDLLQGSNFTVRQVKSYTELVTSPRVLEPVIEELGLTQSAEGLAGKVRATSPLDTVLIDVVASDESPDLAAAIANSTAGSLASVVGELETPAGVAESPVAISTVRPATAPVVPSSPNLKLNVALGLVLGLVVGIGGVLLRELLETRIRSQADVTALTDASVLGVIGFDKEAPNHPLIVQESPHSSRAESFRRLRTNLQFLEFDGRARTLVLTSALPDEGKTTTSINLAITLADAGSRVVLVDADLRRPSVSRYMGLEGSVGLTTVLIGRAALEDVVQPWGNGNLHVISAGQIPPNPSELLGSGAMAQLIDRLGAEYDVVVLDTSPLLPVTDAAILAKLAGAAIVVVGAGKTHRAQLTEALGALQAVEARLLGVVVNRVPGSTRRKDSGYGYYEYGEAPTQTGAAAVGTPAGEKRSGRRRPVASRADGSRADAARPDAARPGAAAREAQGPPKVQGSPSGEPHPFPRISSVTEVVVPRDPR